MTVYYELRNTAKKPETWQVVRLEVTAIGRRFFGLFARYATTETLIADGLCRVQARATMMNDIAERAPDTILKREVYDSVGELIW